MNITTKARSNLSFGDADQYKSWNGRTGGNIPGSLLNFWTKTAMWWPIYLASWVWQREDLLILTRRKFWCQCMPQSPGMFYFSFPCNVPRSSCSCCWSPGVLTDSRYYYQQCWISKLRVGSWYSRGMGHGSLWKYILEQYLCRFYRYASWPPRILSVTSLRRAEVLH